MQRDTQYFIDGNTVSCTVYNMHELPFYATVTVENGDIPSAITSALNLAEKTRDEYETETKED